MAKKNLQGGKKFKSSKHTGGEVEYHEIGKDQIVGKVVRNLGTRQMLVFCNDEKKRICHIRGGLRKRTWIQLGDIVLISLRDLGVGASGGVGSLVGEGAVDSQKGDILARYDPEIYGKLKKERDINPRIFLTVEQLMGNVNYTLDEDNFEFTDQSDSEESESGDGSEAEVVKDKRKKVNLRVEKHVEEVSGDIDIDAI
jgi:initiation factor 1A